MTRFPEKVGNCVKMYFQSILKHVQELHCKKSGCNMNLLSCVTNVIEAPVGNETFFAQHVVQCNVTTLSFTALREMIDTGYRKLCIFSQL